MLCIERLNFCLPLTQCRVTLYSFKSVKNGCGMAMAPRGCELKQEFWKYDIMENIHAASFKNVSSVSLTCSISLHVITIYISCGRYFSFVTSLLWLGTRLIPEGRGIVHHSSIVEGKAWQQDVSDHTASTIRKQRNACLYSDLCLLLIWSSSLGGSSYLTSHNLETPSHSHPEIIVKGL